MTLFSTLDITTTLPDAPTIAQPDHSHDLALMPSHWERRGSGGWWLVYQDGSKLPYWTIAQVERCIWRIGLELPIR